MNDAAVEPDVARRPEDDLARKVEQLRRFASFRRALRVTEGVEDVAAMAVPFVTTELGFTHMSIYAAERDIDDFRLLASSHPPDFVDVPLDRGSEVATTLDTETFAYDLPLARQLAERLESRAVVLALRGGDKVIGFALLATRDGLDDDTLTELAFDLESALYARITAWLRAEELAVLEIQERELVGLLRDVQERDAIIRQDLEEAQRFQQSMLGKPPRVAGAAIEIVYRPLDLVGGDIYAVSLHGRKLRAFVADATGHGVRASLTTMFIKSGYDAVRTSASGPAELLRLLNDNIARAYRSAEMLFSAVCADLDLDTGVVEISSAAHPAVCVVTGGDGVFVEGRGALLGLRSQMSFETHRITIAPGDGIYLLTDGFAEVRGAGGDQYGEERTRDFIRDEHVAGRAAGEKLTEAVLAFAAGGALTDDATMVGVRYGVEDAEPVGPVSIR